jgi:hypothetical protein
MTPKESQLGNLAQKLLAFTRNDQLKWEETADEQTFCLVVDSGMIQIQERPREGSFTPSQPAPHPVEYALSVLNENNITVGTFTGGTTEGGQRLLHELYDAARDSAFRPDRVIDRIDSEITRLAKTGHRR